LEAPKTSPSAKNIQDNETYKEVMSIIASDLKASENTSNAKEAKDKPNLEKMFNN